MIALLCAALSGVMFYLAHGLNDVWQLAWIAPLPVLWLAYGETPRWQVFAASFGAFAASQIYMIQAYSGELPALAIGLSLVGFGALFAFSVMRAREDMRRLPVWARLFVFPVRWTAIEFLYSLVSPHSTFGSVAYSQVAFPPAIQIASLFGLHAVTFLLCLFANAVALAARDMRGTVWIGIGLCLAALGYGYFRLAEPQGDTVQVAGLSNWDLRQRAVRKLDRANTNQIAGQFAAAAARLAERGAKVIVIPETALAADPVWQGAALQPLQDAARQARVTIVAGTMIAAKPWRNAALTFTPDSAVREYDKRHLLLPLERRYSPGNASGFLGGGLAVAICKDLDFPRTIRSDALNAEDRGGIRLLAVPANDFVEDDWLHARMAVMRGVENGFAVVRSAFNGLETVSDAQGRIVASASTNQPGTITLEAKVALGPGATLYTRIGDVFAWLCVAAVVAFTALALGAKFGKLRMPREPV